MNRKKDIIKTIESISGKYSPYEVFSDWVKCCALSISNSTEIFHDKVWKQREKEYIDTMARYSEKEKGKMAEMFSMLVETMDGEMADILGQIYMEAEMGSKSAGQFFTPYHLSELCARLSMLDPDENGVFNLNEPSCGGGGMIIAADSELKRNGFDFQRKMDVVAQDLDWKGVYMCYVQLSLYGIRAVVVQGDTLAKPYVEGFTDPSHILKTPAKKGLLL